MWKETRYVLSPASIIGIWRVRKQIIYFNMFAFEHPFFYECVSGNNIEEAQYAWEEKLKWLGQEPSFLKL